MSSLFFEDLTVGDRYVTGGISLTESQIIEFAFRYDPQSFHLDIDAASKSPFGGLIASGFQTVLLSFRLFVQTALFNESSLGSPGIDELRWLAPVRPGDTIHAEVEVLDVKPSRSKPDRGIAQLAFKTINQHGETVASFTLIAVLRRSAVSLS
jgi:acyl dehydratase